MLFTIDCPYPVAEVQRVFMLWIQEPQYFSQTILRSELIYDNILSSSSPPTPNVDSLLHHTNSDILDIWIRRRMVPRIHRTENTFDQDCFIINRWNGSEDGSMELVNEVVYDSLLTCSSLHRLKHNLPQNTDLHGPLHSPPLLESHDCPFFYPKVRQFSMIFRGGCLSVSAVLVDDADKDPTIAVKPSAVISTPAV